MESALSILIQAAPFGGFTILYLIVMTRYFNKQQKEIKEVYNDLQKESKEMYKKCIEEIRKAYNKKGSK